MIVVASLPLIDVAMISKLERDVTIPLSTVAPPMTKDKKYSAVLDLHLVEMHAIHHPNTAARMEDFNLLEHVEEIPRRLIQLRSIQQLFRHQQFLHHPRDRMSADASLPQMNVAKIFELETDVTTPENMPAPPTNKDRMSCVQEDMRHVDPHATLHLNTAVKMATFNRLGHAMVEIQPLPILLLQLLHRQQLLQQ